MFSSWTQFFGPPQVVLRDIILPHVESRAVEFKVLVLFVTMLIVHGLYDSSRRE